MATVTPNYGWPVPQSSDLVKDGAVAIEALGDAIDATVFGLGSSALTLIKTQTIGTAVATVAVTGAFNSTYDNYKIVVVGGVTNAVANIRMILGASTASYYMGRFAVAYTGGIIGNGSSNQPQWDYCGNGSTTSLTMNVDIYEPNKAVRTRISCNTYPDATTGGAGQGAAGFHDVATAYTDFTLSCFTGATATFTGGTIYVYGYQK